MLLTVDIGTSAFKSAVWDYNGNRLDFYSFALSIDISDGVTHEVDPSRWLRAFEQSCKRLKGLPTVEAIVISGNGPSLVPVQNEVSFFKNQPAANALLWLDRRAEKYQAEAADAAGDFVDACFFLPKSLYLKNEKNELYNKTKYFLGCPEYLAYALTGQARTVFPSDGFERWFWNDSILEKLKLEKEKFPPFIRPGDLFGTLISSTADYFGFKKNIPVISGGPDFFAAILGAGITEPKIALDRTGSSEGINLCTENRIFDRRLMSYGHPVKPFWNLSGIINTAGKAIEWAYAILGVNNFDDFIALASESSKGSGGLVFLPFLAGERTPSSSERASWSGINLGTGRKELANSILEGIGFAVKDILGTMENAGEKAKQLRVTGGLSGCSLLNKIKADITGIEIIEGEYKEAELLGLAVIGACALGKFTSFKEASDAFYRIGKRYEPDYSLHRLYSQLGKE
ncbi:MAG: FGGY-family carbohydrate kinase [Treponema sp.]|nr:FGGY-family carbohydrate kinase [Treponema sp.]